MKKRILFRILSIIVIFTILLPVGSMNLPIFNRYTIILVFWFVGMAFFEPKILFTKNMNWIYICMGLFCFGELTFWHTKSDIGPNLINIIIEYAWIAVPLSMNTYYIHSKDYRGYKIVTLIALIFVLVTSITSIIGLNIFPEASRYMAVGADASDYIFHNLYARMGIATYGFYIIVMVLMPCIGYLIRNTNLRYLKVIFIISSFVMIYSIFKGQHTTILLFALSGLVVSIFNFSKNFKTKVILSIIILIFFSGFLSKSLDKISYIIPETSVSKRLRDIAQTLEEGDYNPETGNTYFVRERLSRSEYSLSNFFMNPIIGSGEAGGHAFWLDRLALYGLVGFIPFIMIFINSIKSNTYHFSYSFKVYYYLAFLIVAFFGLIKGIVLREATFALFFILPGVYYIYYTPANLDKEI